jgi:UDPglucose--hexose-1-phosphate uridylyltransferase
VTHPLLRKDPVTQRWVVMSPDRADLPSPARPPLPPGLPPDACPFCPGSETQTGPEIAAEREAGTRPNASGWSVRVVADRYPIFRIEGGLEKSAEGMYDSMNAVGAHEILVETPDHDRHWADFDAGQLERVLRAAQQRSLDLRNDRRFRHVIWVKNYGLAGSVFRHPHSHVMASAFVPRAIEEELKGFRDYARWKERCVLCDVVKQEQRDSRRMLAREEALVAFAPFASCFPYEFWIVPVAHAHDFGGASLAILRDAARLLQRTMQGVRRVLQDPPFTLVLHSCPLGEFAQDEYHWHLEVVPQPPHLLGPERGTGILINPVLPEVAAERYRAAIA